jgi:hypothetical protein
MLIAAVAVLCAAAPSAQSVAAKRTPLTAQLELLRLPYYGVFDYLSVGVQGGVASVGGSACRASLKSNAAAALRRVPGVEEIVNTIDVLPASHDAARCRRPRERQDAGIRESEGSDWRLQRRERSCRRQEVRNGPVEGPSHAGEASGGS